MKALKCYATQAPQKLGCLSVLCKLNNVENSLCKNKHRKGHVRDKIRSRN